MNENIRNITTEKNNNTEMPENNPKRSCFSYLGKTEETPEELIARGEGSGKPSVCQKL